MTLLWVVLMILSTAAIEPGWVGADYVKWASEASVSYKINYFNVSILTAGVVYFFFLLFRYLKLKSPSLALTGLVFVPIYGLLNLFSYSVQITLVPAMAQSAVAQSAVAQSAMEFGDSIQRVAQWIQANPASIVAKLNGLAYALLGIPSILYGYLLILDSRRFSGLTLILNGILCVIGITGMMLDIRILSMGTLAGGFLFLISLGAFWFEFRVR
jgi:hypothetical protein